MFTWTGLLVIAALFLGAALALTADKILDRRRLNRQRADAGLPPTSKYPRKTTMPPLPVERAAGLPTNIDQPPSRVTRAQFRHHRETRD